MNNWLILLLCLISIFVGLIILTYKLWHHFDDFSAGLSLTGILITGFAVLTIIVVLIASSMRAKKEFYKQQERYEYVMEVIDSMDEYEYANFGITETILKYNEWLEDAKVCKKVYGNWSFYRNLPVEELEYIGLKKKE